MTREEVILSQLNDVQREAVRQIDGPVMVIAGAGSGKTRVLTCRVAYMLTQNINPYNILALTFTNKAADEMRDRVFRLVSDSNAKAVTMGTFHSIFYRILRDEGSKLGYDHNITVYDTDDSRSLIRNIVKDLNLDPKVYAPNHILNRISMAKSDLLSAEEYAQTPEIIAADTVAGRPLLSDIFTRYNIRLKKANAMDFDDLLYYMNVLLRDFPDMLYKYQNRYSYILVDEYQDTNYAQYLIINKLAALNQNICVVGDDAQSIYGFRGANIRNILNFRHDYPDVKIYKLEQNYRSTRNILNAANAVIRRNIDQVPKKLWSDNVEGHKINLVRANGENEEAIAVAQGIFEIKMNEQAQNRQFAILYRTNIQSRALEEAMVKNHIPYKIYGNVSFYKRREIKNVLAYFRVIINHYDEESLRRVINYPLRGIGDTTLAKLSIVAKENDTALWNVVLDPLKYNVSLSRPILQKIDEFATMIGGFSAQLTKIDAYGLARQIIVKTGIAKSLSTDADEKERLDHIEELLSAIKDFTENPPERSFNESTGELIEKYFPSLDQFMESIALLSDENDRRTEDEDKVKLMTIHAAKGLEFDYVFVTGMEENLFPSALCVNSRQEIEEERRLFYVALTRARKQVTLTCAQTRRRFGSVDFCEESRFIEEIPQEYLNITHKVFMGTGLFGSKNFSQRSHGKTPAGYRSALINTPSPDRRLPMKSTSDMQLEQVGTLATPDQIKPDVRVYHVKFGYGTVQSVEGNNSEIRARVNFETVGTKILLLKYAKLLIPK